MSTYIDKKYIGMVSPLLKRFKWKKDNLANCRCPICGDSTKRKTVARGFFYQKGNDFFYRCHNCGYGSNLYNFLEKVSPYLCKQYALERFIAGEEGKANYKKPSLEKLYPYDSTPVFAKKVDHFTPARESKECIDFLESRKIPEDRWEDIGYTDDFSLFAKQFDESYDARNEPRIIILVKNENGDVVGAQGRCITCKKNAPKYLTIKKKDTDKLIFGIDKVNKNEQVYVVEGPIDSTFLKNSVACLGTGSFIDMTKIFPNAIYVLDNEPRNHDTVGIQKKLIESGFKVCVWPEYCKEKDINDMVLKNGIDYVNNILENNVFDGLKAHLVFTSWKRV